MADSVSPCGQYLQSHILFQFLCLAVKPVTIHHLVQVLPSLKQIWGKENAKVLDSPVLEKRTVGQSDHAVPVHSLVDDIVLASQLAGRIQVHSHGPPAPFLHQSLPLTAGQVNGFPRIVLIANHDTDFLAAVLCCLTAVPLAAAACQGRHTHCRRQH